MEGDEIDQKVLSNSARSPSLVGESPIGLKITFCSSVLSPEGKDQVGDEMEQSACHRAVREQYHIAQRLQMRRG
ncbi:hypothetical protein H5410_003120 [Solanum commersonii]|uniref:Uncharacterized protein n=1 Tax=Solanum commersonii TaxID=4109 RepID=A0A9J6B455_SOLCO|nr:hypothetical protein H5410_003120 [Solanum commersonii]